MAIEVSNDSIFDEALKMQEQEEKDKEAKKGKKSFVDREEIEWEGLKKNKEVDPYCRKSYCTS